MKSSGKSSKPIIAASSTKHNGDQPAQPDAQGSGAKRVSRVPNGRLRTQILERVSDGVLAFDAQMNHVYVDERAGELLGREPGQLVGKNFWQEYPNSAGTPFADACQRAFKTQNVVPFDGYFPSTNSWFEGRVYPSDDGLSVLISDRGLPDPEEMLHALEVSEEKFSKAFHSSPVAKAIVRTRDKNFVDINQSFLKLFELERDEVLGNTSGEVGIQVSPASREALTQIWKQKGSVRQHEAEIKIRSGEKRHVLLSLEQIELDAETCILISALDITEQKRAEKQIRAISEFPMQNPNPVMRFRRDGELLFANPAAAPLLNSWKQSEGKPTLPTGIRQKLTEVADSQKNKQIELEDGSKTFNCLFVPVPGADYINLYFSDITERIQAQESLQALVHQTTAGITRIDLKGRYLFANQAFCDMVGYSASELMDKTIWEISQADDIPKNQRMFERMVIEGTPYQLEKRLVRRNGTVLWVTIGTSPLRDARGQVQAAVSVIVDITRRKRAEESLLDNARRTLYLSTLSDTLRQLTTPMQIEAEAPVFLGTHLKASRVAYAAVSEAGIATVRSNYVDGLTDLTGEFPLHTYLPADALEKVYADRTYFITRSAAPLPGAKDADLVRAQVIVPLTRQGKLVAVLFVQQNQERVWRSEDLNLVEETAERMQSAIERARAERNLRESEKRFRILANTAPSLVWSTRPDGKVEYLNDRWLAYTGLKFEESVSGWEQTIHPDDYERCMQAWDHSLTTGEEYMLELRYRRYDGEYRWFQSQAVPERNDDGQIIAWHGVTTDIHERVRKETELQEVINRTPFMLTRCSRDLHYRFVSRAYAEMVGRTPEELAGRSIQEVMGESGIQTILPYVQKALQGERVEFEAEVPFEGLGTPILHIVYVPDYDEQGEVVGWFGSLINVTERKKVEDALRTSEEKYRQIVETAHEGIWELDEHARTSFVNPRMAAMLGYTPDEMVGRSPYDFLIPEDHARGEQRLHEALQGIATSSNEFRYRRKDGSILWTLSGSTPKLDEEGNFIGSFAMLTDISERKQYEESLIEYARRQTALYTLADALNRIETMQDIYDSSLDAIVNALQCDRASILLFDDSQRMRFVAWRGLSEEYRKATDGHSPWKYGEQNPTPLSYGDITTADLNDSLKAVIAREGIGSLTFIPIVLQDRLIGKFMVYFNTQHNFSEMELDLGVTISRQLASAIDRNQREEALRARSEEIETLMEVSPIGIYVAHDPQCAHITGNPAAYDLVNLPQDDDVNISKSASAEEQPSYRVFRDGVELGVDQLPMQAAARLGTEIEEETLELRFENGSHRYVYAYAKPLFDANGKTRGAVAAMLDISERKQAEDRLALLAEISDLTRKQEDPVELMETVAETIGKHLHVKRCLFNEIDLDQDLETIHSDYHVDTHSVAGVHRITDYSSITTQEMVQGRTVVNHDSKLDPRTAQDYERSYVADGERAYVAVPLTRDGRWVASLWVSDDKPRVWSRDEVSLLETIAERTWTATEKLRIHVALRDSEERLRVTYNSTAVGFATLNPDTSFVDVNQAFCNIVGYSREELFGMLCDNLNHPDHLENSRAHVAQLLAGEVPSFVVEKIYIRRDGSEIWVQNSVSLVRDAEGKPLHMIIITQDITERKRTEDALHQLNLQLESRVQKRTAELQAAYEFLRQSEATARLILESTPDAIIVVDKNGQIVYGNTSVDSLFGYSAEELIGKSVEVLIPGRFHEQHLAYRQEYGVQQERRNMGLGKDLFGQRKDNTEFPVEVMLSPISNNTTWDVMITIRDNTQQKEAQEALRANEEKLRKLFAILPVGISFLDNEGKISEMNTALSQIMGLTKSELMEGRFKPRRYIRSNGTPMPPTEFASNRARTEQKPVYNVETGILKEDGDIIWTSVSATPVDVADVDVVVATIDITERKKAEDTLHKHRERLRILSRRLVEVQEDERRAIAHELHDRVGQNLAALNLNLNILRSQLSAEALKVIGTRLDDSVALVNQILTITRNVMSDLRSNVLDDYGLESALHEFSDKFTQRTGVQVLFDKTGKTLPRLDPNIEMTLLRIAQEALTNVSRHAQADAVTVTTNMDQEAVYMSIEDNGIGILSWQKANQPGSHGLRIIRERAEAFGGSLQVHSAYKKGTRIEVKIPLGSTGSLKVQREKRS